MSDLEAIKARAEAATPGPWDSRRSEWADDPDLMTVDGEPAGDPWWVHHDGWIDADDTGLFMSEADAAFIAHARTDVPALVAEVERLRDVVAALEAENARLRCPDCDGQGWTLEQDHASDCRAQYGGPCDGPCPVQVQAVCRRCSALVSASCAPIADKDLPF